MSPSSAKAFIKHAFSAFLWGSSDKGLKFSHHAVFDTGKNSENRAYHAHNRYCV